MSAGAVLVVQGTLTLAGAIFGAFMDEPMILALTSTGGVLLLGLGSSFWTSRRFVWRTCSRPWSSHPC